MEVKRTIEIVLNEKEKDELRRAHALLVKIEELAGGTCQGCPLWGYCDGKSECPDAVIEDVFFELTGEAI